VKFQCLDIAEGMSAETELRIAKYMNDTQERETK